MRKINLTPIKVGEKDYQIKETIIGCLFHPDMKLPARDLVTTDKLAQKIEAGELEVLLEDAEYEKVKKAIETQKGWQRGDLEFVTRILDAPEVPIKEA